MDYEFSKMKNGDEIRDIQSDWIVDFSCSWIASCVDPPETISSAVEGTALAVVLEGLPGQSLPPHQAKLGLWWLGYGANWDN